MMIFKTGNPVSGVFDSHTLPPMFTASDLLIGLDFLIEIAESLDAHEGIHRLGESS